MCVCVLVAQSCLTLCDPMDSGPQGSSVHGILQARVLESGAIAFSIYGLIYIHSFASSFPHGLLQDSVLKISVKPISFNVSFKTRVSLLIFCFDDLFNGVNSVQFSHSVVSDSL